GRAGGAGRNRRRGHGGRSRSSEARASPAAAGAREQAAARLLGLDAGLQPETKAVEAPRRRPAEERPEDQGVDETAGTAEAGAVVVLGHEADAVRDGHVAPVATSLGDQRPRVVRAEAQCGRARPVGCLTLADALARAPDLEAEADPRRVEE